MWIYGFYLVYAIDLIGLVFGMAYVSKLWIQRTTTINPYLSGKRLYEIMWVPFLWFFYIFSDFYAVFTLIKTTIVFTDEIMWALYWKMFRQLVGCVAGYLNTKALIGKLKYEHR